MVKFGIIFLYNLTNHEKNKYKNTIAFKTYFLLANELICNTIYFDITYGNSIPLRDVSDSHAPICFPPTLFVNL